MPFYCRHDIFHHVFSSDSGLLRDRLSTLIKMSATDSMNGLAYSGHHYAMMHVASKLEGLPAPKLREKESGLTAVRFINKLALSVQNGNTDVLDEILQEMAVLARATLVNDKVQSVMINTSPDYRYVVNGEDKK